VRLTRRAPPPARLAQVVKELPAVAEEARIKKLKSAEVDAELGEFVCAGNMAVRKAALLSRVLAKAQAEAVDAATALRKYCTDAPLGLTQQSVRHVVCSRGAAAFVTITDLAHSLLHALANAAVTELTTSGQATAQRLWRASFAGVRAWAVACVSPLLDSVLAELQREWTAVLDEAVSGAAAAVPGRAAGADVQQPGTCDAQAAAFALGAVLEWFVADLSLRAGHLQQPEATDSSSEVTHAGILLVLKTPGVHASAGFSAAMVRAAQQWQKSANEDALEGAVKRARTAAAKAAAARAAAQEDDAE
jgi:hypothetical protein